MMSAQSDESLRNLSFKNLDSAWPILSLDGDDLLYLKTTPKFRFSDRWVVAVDLVEKTLKVEARSFGRYTPSLQMYSSCALSKHLNMTPGIKVLAFCEIKLGGTTVNDQNATTAHVAQPDFCETENKRQRLSAEKVDLAQNGAQSVVQNAHILSVAEPDSCETENKRPRLSAEKVNLTQHGAQNVIPNTHLFSVAEPDSCETENKRPRISAGEVNLAQNSAQGIVQNAHIPSLRPVQNSQPPQMNILPGQSWWPWPHVNNLHVPFQPPQQYFNKWGGTSVPGYAPSAPAPNLSYGNYYPFNNHSEWWQPPPSMQQPAPIRAFGAHEAPRPCFNNWYGASNHGYSQQLPACNLNAYGSRLDYGNYQVQSQQHPPIQVMRPYATLQQPLVQVQDQLTASGVWIS